MNEAPAGEPLTLDRIERTRSAIAPWAIETPVLEWSGVAKDALVGADTRVVLKLELLQRTGSFKPRGALSSILALDADERAAGVTAVSAGNHAIAVAYAAGAIGTDAKVVMHKAANPFRVAQCRELGAEVVLAADIHGAFAEMARIRDEEGRAVIHPFEGPDTISGTATLGLEFARQAPELDAVIVPVGGGGLIAGSAGRPRPPVRRRGSMASSRTGPAACATALHGARRSTASQSRPSPTAWARRCICPIPSISSGSRWTRSPPYPTMPCRTPC